MKYVTLLLIVFFISNEISAQGEAEDSIVTEILSIKKTRPYIKAQYGFGALANRASTQELIDFFNSGFLEREDKEDIIASLNGTLRFGYLGKIGIEYNEPGYQTLDYYKKGQGFSINYQYYTSGKINPDLIKLMLNGNKPYAGQTLDLGKTNYEYWNYTNLNYHFDYKHDSLPPIRFTVGLNVGHDHSAYSIKKGDIYTDPDGAFLNMDVDYKLRDRNLEAAAMAGLGLNLGASTVLRLSKKSQIELAIEDLGFLVWNNGRMLDADSTFRFTGVDVGNVFEINDSIIDLAKGEYEDAFYYNESGSYTRLTPFKLAATYSKDLNKGKLKELQLKAEYRHLAGYLPKISASTLFRLGRNHRLVTGVSAGGFNILSVDLGYQLKMGKYWKLDLGVSNLNGIILPMTAGGGYGFMALSYDL